MSRRSRRADASTRVVEPEGDRDWADSDDPVDWDEHDDGVRYTRRGRVKADTGARTVVWMLGLLLFLLAGAYGAAVYWTEGKVPRGASVQGVDVGGLDRPDALELLRSRLASRAQAPVRVQIGGRVLRYAPSDLGLRVDLPASLDATGAGEGWEPEQLWTWFAGGDDVSAVVDVDERRMSWLLSKIARRVDVAPVNGDVRFARGDIKRTAPRDGVRLSREGSEVVITTSWLRGEVARLPVIGVRPTITSRAVAKAVQDFAAPALSGPVTLRLAGSSVTLPPRAFARALEMSPEGEQLVPGLKAQVLIDVVSPLLNGIGGAPKDADVRIVDGRPRVIPARPGVTFSPDALTNRFLSVLTRRGDERVLRVPAATSRPVFTTRQARALRIVEQVGAASVRFSDSPGRNANLARATTLLDDTLVRPGEDFSLNRVLGPRTAANGFTRPSGPVGAGGVADADGDGVDQVATALYNAAFFAGLRDLEHHTHPVYVAGYPPGRDATVRYGSSDLRFADDTRHGVLVQATMTPARPGVWGQVTVRLWSTRVWDVSAREGQRTGIQQPGTVVDRSRGCTPRAGVLGFTTQVTREFRRPGSSALVKTETSSATYAPVDAIVCR